MTRARVSTPIAHLPYFDGYAQQTGCSRWKRQFMCSLTYLVMQACSLAMGDEVQQARFIKEAPKAWAELEEYVSRSHSVVRETTTIETRDASGGPSSKQVMHRTIETKLAGARLLVITRTDRDWPDPAPSAAAGGENPGYYFQLVQTADEGPWSVKRLELPATSSARGRSASAVGQSMAATGLYDVRLKNVVGKEGFEVREARAIPIADGELVEIKFRYKPAGDDRSRLRGGTALFAPDRYWTLVKATAQIAYRGGESPSTYSYEYRVDPAGFPLLTRVEVDFDRDDASHQTTIKEYTLFEHVDVADEEFLLAAFGLPEPSVAASSHPGWRWWVMLAGVAALTMAVALRRLVTSRESVNPTNA